MLFEWRDSSVGCGVLVLILSGLLMLPSVSFGRPAKQEENPRKSSGFINDIEASLVDRIEKYEDDPDNKWLPWMKTMQKRLEQGEVNEFDNLPQSEQMRLLYLYHDYQVDRLEGKSKANEETIREQKTKREFARLILEVERRIHKLKKEFDIEVRTEGENEGYGDIYGRANEIMEKLVREAVRKASRAEVIRSLEIMIGEAGDTGDKKLLKELRRTKNKIRESNYQELSSEELEVIAVSLLRITTREQDRSEFDRGRRAFQLLAVRNLRELVQSLGSIRDLQDRPFIEEQSVP